MKSASYLFFLKQGKHSSLVSRARGVGTFCAFDLPTPQVRDKLIVSLRQKGPLSMFVCYCSLTRFFSGVSSGGSGDRSIRLRPQLVFMPKHAHQFLTILDGALKEL